MEIQEQNRQNLSVVSTGNWIVTLLLMYIPVINLILLLVWALSSRTPASKSNWAKAHLIFTIIHLALVLLFGSFILTAISSLAKM